MWETYLISQDWFCTLDQLSRLIHKTDIAAFLHVSGSFIVFPETKEWGVSIAYIGVLPTTCGGVPAARGQDIQTLTRGLRSLPASTTAQTTGLYAAFYF